MAAGAALPGLFCTFAAMVLLIFASVSTPVWNKISFLNASSGGAVTHFGVWGYDGTSSRLGYYFPGNFGDSPFTQSGGTFHNLTFALVLIPIAAALSALAFLFGLCGAAYHRIGTVFMTITTALAFLVTLVGWVIEMVLFGVTRHHLRDNGIPASFGNANWLVLGALIALFFAFFAGFCGSFGRYSSRRKTAY